jgi:ceramide glucosyltransferase
VILNIIFGSLALLSLVLMLWQWRVACRFPLHQRADPAPRSASPAVPAVTLFKPLKGCDAETEGCLRSWFTQQYSGPVQILFAVATAEDPVCAIIDRLLQEFHAADAQLLICGPLVGANAKVSKLVQLVGLAKHELFVVSDADVRVPPDFLANLVSPLVENTSGDAQLRDTERSSAGGKRSAAACGVVNCFYRLANPTTLAMQCEAIAVNADFWSQVLQSRSLKPLDFALGAVMATRCQCLEEIGGFVALADCLADDYQLGNRIARRGYRIELATVIVECWSEPMGWRAVWKHQLRWARTIRVCQPGPYFFSILSNPTLWPLLWLILHPALLTLALACGCWLVRISAAFDLQRRLTRQRAPWYWIGLVPFKDLCQGGVWLLAFLGNRVEWRGRRMRLRSDGTLVK